MSEVPCLCTETYQCTPCRMQQVIERRKALRRMLDNRLMTMARDFELPDDIWCRLIYDHLENNLDRLLLPEEP